MSANFSEQFGTNSVRRTSLKAQLDCGNGCTDPEPDPCPSKGGSEAKMSHWPGVHQIQLRTFKAIKEETGKPWLVGEYLCYDAEACRWDTSTTCRGICELPSKYGPGDTLPSFNGALDIVVNGAAAQISGADVVPEGMSGFIVCIDKELCYVNSGTVDIPDEVWTEDTPPPDDSKLWLNDGVLKGKNPQGLWVETNDD